MKTNLVLIFSLFIGLVNAQAPIQADTVLLKKHLEVITAGPPFRTYRNVEVLDKMADYIAQTMAQYADTVYRQPFEVNGKKYQNVICSFGTTHSRRIIVGAHYDVCGDAPGSDDNASGMAGLLEICRLLHDQKLNYRIDLVAFTLEEPPFFDTQQMGSFIHAKSLADEKVDVYGMVCLEMIGFYSDQPHSQQFPLNFLKIFYGHRANFITLVNKLNPGKFSHRFNRHFRHANQLKTKKFNGPASVEGVDFSDHLNYWHFGYSALMITDTSFYRNKNYHRATDTIETLDIQKMAKVVNATVSALMNMK